MIFISKKMITKAVGTVNRRIAVAAMRKRRMSMFASPVSTTRSTSSGPTPVIQAMRSPTLAAASSARSGRMTLPLVESRSHGFETVVTRLRRAA